MNYGYGYFEEDRLGRLGDRSLWRRIIGFVLPYRGAILLSVLLSLLIIASSLLLPHLVRIGIDRYITNTSLPDAARLKGVGSLALLFVTAMAIAFLANFFQVVVLELTGQRVMHRLRQVLFQHLLTLEMSFFHEHPSGKLVTRLTNDIQNMHEMFTSVIVTLFNDLLRIAGILVILFWLNWRLALIMTVLLPLMLLFTVHFSRQARNAFRTIRTRLARINSFLQEALAGQALIQLFGREEQAAGEFQELNNSYLAATLYQIRIFGIYMPMLEVFSAAALGCIIWYGGLEILRGSMTIGILVAFISYMRLFFQPLRELSQKYSIVQSAMASAERIFQLLDTEGESRGAEEKMRSARAKGRIEFNDVGFGYKTGQPVLEDFCLAIEPGETVAIVGATGAGKTTIINLLERLYLPDNGSISLDGTRIDRLDIHWLRQQIGLVMQDVFLLPDTIRENILLGRVVDDAQLASILDRAELAGFISQLPEGIETIVGEGGIELSAGQRQLLALARALAGRPPILVFDEATASVDSATEKKIERAIAAVLAERTCIVIAHRLSTIRQSDRIIVLEHGRILEQGSHDALLARQGRYYQLQQLQIL